VTADDTLPERIEDGARHSRWVGLSVRVGLVAYAVVHLLVAWVAIRLTFDHGSGAATGQGALAQLAGETTGRGVLAAMAASFVALTLWQLTAAAVGFRELSGWSRHLMRLGAVCRALTYAYFAWASSRLALAGSGGSGRSPESLTSRVLAAPAGPLILGAVGVAVAATGLVLAVFGWRRKFLPQLDQQARSRDRRVPIQLVGQVGYVVKGLALLVVGGLLVWAAGTQDPRKSGGLDQELYLLLGHRAGEVAVVVVGLGIGCFGLFLLARSRHLSHETLLS
jgi:Domain of Unknown Function (DUF1206)